MFFKSLVWSDPNCRPPKAKQLGVSGKGSVHPKQIAALSEVFTPTADEIDRARRMTSSFEEADTGLAVIDGKLIEKPVLSGYVSDSVTKEISKTPTLNQD